MADQVRKQPGTSTGPTPGDRPVHEPSPPHDTRPDPPDGRDEAPAEPVEKGKRSPNDPWMGGG
jgi:hypothetical protein